MTTRQRREQQTHAYRVLIDLAEEVVGKARAGIERTRTMAKS
jgi:transposase, IS5 family